MAERTLPWWRKVIDYAISGIRSLLRPARPNSGEMSEPAESREEISAKQESIPEQITQEVAEPATQEVVETSHANRNLVQPNSQSVEAVTATVGTEKYEEQLGEEPEPALIAKEPPESVAEQRTAEAPAPAPEESKEIEAPEPVPESVVEQHSEEKHFEEEQIEDEHFEPVQVQEPTVASEPIATHESIFEQEPAAVPVESKEMEAAEHAAEPAPEPVFEKHFEEERMDEEHFEPKPIQELVEVIEPASERESIFEQGPTDMPQPAMETKSDSVLMKEEIVVAAISAEPNIAVEEDSSMELEEAVRELSEVKVEEEIAASVEASAEIEAAPVADEPVAETAGEPLAESAAATPAMETEAPESQPEEEDPKLVAAPPAAHPAPAKTEAELKTAARIVAAVKAREESADPSPFSILVDQVYDGPLDLLLDLIRKQDIDIYDIPIAKITAQFLAYVNQLKASDVDVAGEFIYTASLLIHIKSKMLLPRAPGGPDDAAEDPRRELVERLLEHEKFKNAAQMLQQKQMLEAATWTNPGVREFKDDEAAEPEIAADTVDLVRIFQVILDRARNRPILNVEEDSVTVGQMIQFLTRRLTMEDKPVALSKLLSNTKSERALIAMFLALLELVRLQAILLRQDRHFTDIFIKKNSGFEAAMEQSLANARDDWR